MTKKQALSLLTLIADLYAVVNTPDQIETEPMPVPDTGNGAGRSKQSQPMTVD